MTPANSVAKCFFSLAELQEYHARLSSETGKDVLAIGNLGRISEFVHRAVATGAVLDAYADRGAAQSLITFWTSRVAAAHRDREHKRLWVSDEAKDESPEPEFGDTLLKAFDPAVLLTTVIDPTERWLAQQSEIDRAMARRMLLRLVRLREDDTIEVRSSATGVCDDLEPQGQAERVLATLIKLGAVRVVQESGAQSEVALRSPTLVNHWKSLASWIDGRRAFRKKALAWAQRPRLKEASLQQRWRTLAAVARGAVMRLGGWSDKLMQRLIPEASASDDESVQADFEEAETYRDRTPVELKFVYQKRLADKERNEKKLLAARGISAVALLFVVLFPIAVVGWFYASHQAVLLKVPGNRHV